MPINPTKQNIIETAFNLFKEKGYSQVTVNEICEACRITKTTFYYHLTSKEDIITNFYESVTQSLANRLIDIFSAGNNWEQLMVCFDTLIDATERIGCDLFGQLYIMNLKENKGTFDFDDDLTKVAVLLIARAQKSGQIRNQSPALRLYRAAAHAFEGYELMWCIKNGGFDRKEMIRSAMEDIFDVEPSLRMEQQSED